VFEYFFKIRLILLCLALVFFLPMAGKTEEPAATAEKKISEAAPQQTGTRKTEKKSPKGVTLNFVNMELSEVITNISKITGKNFIWDEKVKGKVTIISPEGIPVEEAWEVFQAVMRFNGYQLVPVNGVKNLYKIVRVQEASGQTIPTYTEGLWSPRTESFVTRLLELQYIDAQSAAQVLNNLKSKEAKIIPYPPTNTLIVIESANNLNRLVRVLQQMDVPVKLPRVKIVKLKYAPAENIARELSQIFSEEYLGALMVGEASSSFLNQKQARRKTSQTGSQQSGKALKIISDTRTNSLIIIAAEEIIDEVIRVIEELDVAVEGEEGIYVYYCRNASAGELASTLSSLAEGGKTSAAGLRAAAAEAREKRPGGAKTKPPPSGGQLTLGTLSGEVRITADEATNSLVIVASQRDYTILRSVIEKLDVRRRQVFVEAVILEVELSRNDSFGTSLAGAAAIDHEAAVFGSTALGGLNSLGILPALTSGESSLGEVMPGGFSVGALGKTVTLNVGGTTLEVPTFSALFNALVATNNVNVLSTPNLLTTDNEQAEIVVGQNVPIPTGQTVGTAGTTTVTIQRQNVGIKMKVTPQISESDTIRMVIFTEISGVVQTAVAGIDVNTLGITTSIKSAETTVVVDDHQTVVIGGLIENRKTRSTSKVPFLGDIPILGWLFKSRGGQNTKTNLVILLTPHIVRGPEDMTHLTERYNRRRKRFLDEATGGRYEEPFYMEPLILPEENAASPEGTEPMPETSEEGISPQPEPFTPRQEGTPAP